MAPLFPEPTCPLSHSFLLLVSFFFGPFFSLFLVCTISIDFLTRAGYYGLRFFSFYVSVERLVSPRSPALSGATLLHAFDCMSPDLLLHCLRLPHSPLVFSSGCFSWRLSKAAVTCHCTELGANGILFLYEALFPVERSRSCTLPEVFPCLSLSSSDESLFFDRGLSDIGRGRRWSIFWKPLLGVRFWPFPVPDRSCFVWAGAKLVSLTPFADFRIFGLLSASGTSPPVQLSEFEPP